MAAELCCTDEPQLEADRWSKLWQHRDDLVRIAKRRLPEYADVEDVVHEALADAAANRELDIQRAGAWLNTVVRNKCVDVLRERTYYSRRVAFHRRLERSVIPIDEAICDHDQARYLETTLESLPKAQATAIRLLATGLSGKEIGARMGVSPKAVENLLRKARMRLRDLALGVLGLVCLRRATKRSPSEDRTVAAVAAIAIAAATTSVMLSHPHDGAGARRHVEAIVERNQADEASKIPGRTTEGRPISAVFPGHPLRSKGARTLSSSTNADGPALIPAHHVRVGNNDVATPVVKQHGPFTDIIASAQNCVQRGIVITPGYIGCPGG